VRRGGGGDRVGPPCRTSSRDPPRTRWLVITERAIPLRPDGATLSAMRRRPWHRVFAALLGTCFLMGSMGPLGADQGCPMHADGTYATSMATMPSMPSAPGSDHLTPVGAEHHEKQVPSDNHDKRPCTCPGCCCAVIALTPGRLVGLPVVPARIVVALGVWTTGIHRPERPDVVLPYPNGPPALHV
jgi:hypothetical protein